MSNFTLYNQRSLIAITLRVQGIWVFWIQFGEPKTKLLR